MTQRIASDSNRNFTMQDGNRLVEQRLNNRNQRCSDTAGIVLALFGALLCSVGKEIESDIIFPARGICQLSIVGAGAFLIACGIMIIIPNPNQRAHIVPNREAQNLVG
jgi:hypothetical protein